MGVEIQYIMYNCTLKIWEELLVVLIWIYLFFMKLISLWLAFKTRNVKITALNDSKYIAIIVYITMLLLVLGAIVYFAPYDHVIIFVVLFSSLTYISMTAILGLTFLPKVIYWLTHFHNCFVSVANTM